jgi:hypothetical protein
MPPSSTPALFCTGISSRSVFAASTAGVVVVVVAVVAAAAAVSSVELGLLTRGHHYFSRSVLSMRSSKSSVLLSIDFIVSDSWRATPGNSPSRK